MAGRRIELRVKDDAGVADTTKRLAQELIVRDKVGVLAGFGLTPLAMATAPLASRAKMPTVVMAAARSSVTEASPYVVRTSHTTPQVTSKIAEWTGAQGMRRVVTVVPDYGPGIDAEKTFIDGFVAAGGEVAESLRVPLQNPDFSPFLQEVADAAPDAIFVFAPSGAGAQVMKQFVERGLDKSGSSPLADGSVTDDDILNGMGDAALAATAGFHCSAAHDSDTNRACVSAFKAANGNGDALIGAMKGLCRERPRGPVQIDPETRDIVQNVHLCRAARADGELCNIEFETFEAVKDPAKTGS